MKRRTTWIAAVSRPWPVMATDGHGIRVQRQVEGAVTVAAHGTVTCGAPFTVTATFVDANGTPVAGQSVDWSFSSSPSNSDTINADADDHQLARASPRRR